MTEIGGEIVSFEVPRKTRESMSVAKSRIANNPAESLIYSHVGAAAAFAVNGA